MIVYSSKFLRQSFAHFKARYEALCAMDIVLQGLAEDPSNKGRARHRKRRETIVRAGQRLARASHVLPAFLVHLCFSLPHGFIQGALQVQKTDTIFSFAHVCPSRAFALAASRAIAASCGDVAGSSLCLVAGP